MSKPRVLIVCTGNAARSQMAEGLLRHDAGDRFEVSSAGIYPSYVRPLAIEAMREVGIDISAQRSKSVEEFVDQNIDYVITITRMKSARSSQRKQNAFIGAFPIQSAPGATTKRNSRLSATRAMTFALACVPGYQKLDLDNRRDLLDRINRIYRMESCFLL